MAKKPAAPSRRATGAARPPRGRETTNTPAKHRDGEPRRKAGQSQIVNLRVPIQVVEDMDQRVLMGQYRSRSEFVLASIRFYLDYIEYKESYNTRSFDRGMIRDLPGDRFERLKYLRRQ